MDPASRHCTILEARRLGLKPARRNSPNVTDRSDGFLATRQRRAYEPASASRKTVHRAHLPPVTDGTFPGSFRLPGNEAANSRLQARLGVQPAIESSLAEPPRHMAEGIFTKWRIQASRLTPSYLFPRACQFNSCRNAGIATFVTSDISRERTPLPRNDRQKSSQAETGQRISRKFGSSVVRSSAA